MLEEYDGAVVLHFHADGYQRPARSQPSFRPRTSISFAIATYLAPRMARPKEAFMQAILTVAGALPSRSLTRTSAIDLIRLDHHLLLPLTPGSPLFLLNAGGVSSDRTSTCLSLRLGR